MHNCQSLRTASQAFLVDECGGTLMEVTLVAALLVVVGVMIWLAIRKLNQTPV